MLSDEPLPPASSALPSARYPVDGADAELLRQVAMGECAALATLYERHAPAAYAVALQLARDPARARRALTDAFVGLWFGCTAFRTDVAVELRRRLMAALGEPPV